MTTQPPKTRKVTAEELEQLRFVVVYRTPYEEDEPVGLFRMKATARATMERWKKELHDDEDLYLTEADLSEIL